jgi:hypothetical protein
MGHDLTHSSEAASCDQSHLLPESLGCCQREVFHDRPMLEMLILLNRSRRLVATAAVQRAVLLIAAASIESGCFTTLTDLALKIVEKLMQRTCLLAQISLAVQIQM